MYLCREREIERERDVYIYIYYCFVLFVFARPGKYVVYMCEACVEKRCTRTRTHAHAHAHAHTYTDSPSSFPRVAWDLFDPAGNHAR